MNALAAYRMTVVGCHKSAVDRSSDFQRVLGSGKIFTTGREAALKAQ